VSGREPETCRLRHAVQHLDQDILWEQWNPSPSLFDKSRIPGLTRLAWPFIGWFTDRIFQEDKMIVEAEQAAHDAQGCDRNNEVFPAIKDLRALLVRCGSPSRC